MKAEEWNDKGVELSGRGKVDKAILAFSTALELEPANPRIIYNLSLAFIKKEDWEAAEKLLNRASELLEKTKGDQSDPLLSADISVERGLCHYSQGNFSEAEKLYHHALEIDPLNSRGWNNLGVVYFQDSKFEDAAEVFRTAVKLDPENADAWFNLRDSYEELGDSKKARQADRSWRELQ